MRAILTYHSIDTSGSPISVHPDAFDRHIAWLRSGQVRVATIHDLVALPHTEDAVAITFDDGFANFSDLVAPRLLGHGLPVTLFVVSEQVGKTNRWRDCAEAGIPDLPLLDWPALARLREQGAVLGAHSRTHVDLTRLGRGQIEDEVNGSAETIERQVGVRPDVFAYPYGRLNASVTEIVSRAFRYGCTTELSTLPCAVVPAQLPRLDMYYFQSPERLTRWGTPAFERYITLRHGMRRVRQMLASTTRSHVKVKQSGLP
jgi:peptidoglycan/xylan/chitin deacetylase (PgdA/CDA1 family)